MILFYFSEFVSCMVVFLCYNQGLPWLTFVRTSFVNQAFPFLFKNAAK